MGLRQDNKDRAAPPNRGKSGHVADLRRDLVAQSRIRKGPRRRGRRDRDKNGEARENVDYQRQKFAGRRRGTRNDRCRFDHGSQAAPDGIAQS